MDVIELNNFVHELSNETDNNILQQKINDFFKIYAGISSNLIEILNSEQLNEQSMIFIISLIISKNNYSDFEIQTLKNFVIEHFRNCEADKLINSTYLYKLVDLFIYVYRSDINDIYLILDDLINDKQTKLLGLKIATFLVEIKSFKEDINKLFSLGIRCLIDNYQSDTIISHVLGLISTLFKYKEKKVIISRENVMSLLSRLDNNFIIKYLQEEEPLDEYILNILYGLLELPPSSFVKMDNKTSFVEHTIKCLVNHFETKNVRVKNIYSILRIIEKINDLLKYHYCSDIIDLKNKLIDFCIYILKKSINRYPGYVEYIFKFWNSQYNNQYEPIREVDEKALKRLKSCVIDIFLKYKPNFEFVSYIVTDVSSNFTLELVNFLVSQFSIDDIYLRTKEFLLNSISDKDSVYGCYSFDIINKILKINHNEKFYFDFLTTLNQKITNIPYITKDSTDNDVYFEIQLINFLSFISKELLRVETTSKYEYLKHNYNHLTSIYKRFFKELNINNKSHNIRSLLIKSLNFSDFNTNMVKLLFNDSEFLETLSSINFFVYQTDRSDIMMLYRNLFSILFSMSTPNLLDFYMLKVTDLFNSRENYSLFFLIISGCISAKNCVIDYFIHNFLKQYSSSIYNMLSDNDLNIESVISLTSFMIDFSHKMSSAELEYMSNNVISSFRFFLSTCTIIINNYCNNDNLFFVEVFSNILHVTKFLMKWNSINIGILQHYKDNRFNQLYKTIMDKVLTIPFKFFIDYPKFSVRYIKFIKISFLYFPYSLKAMGEIYVTHVLQQLKEFLIIKNNEFVGNSSLAIAEFLSSDFDFKIYNDIINEYKKISYNILFKHGKTEFIGIGKLVFIFLRLDEEFYSNFINNIEILIEAKNIKAKEEFEYIDFKNSFRLINNYDNDSIKKFLQKAETFNNFLFSKGINLEDLLD